jgi:hypothetical protein
MHDKLRQLIEEEVSRPVSGAAMQLVDAIRARHRNGIAAVIFYGSCLRQPDTKLDAVVFDFYLLIDEYRRFYDRSWPTLANYMMPPNVFQISVAAADGRRLQGKYAVVSLAHFCDLVTPRTFHSYFWARFAQPTRLVYARDERIKAIVTDALAQSVATLAGRAAGLMGVKFSPADLWKEAFRQTYAAELRAEQAERGERIYLVDAARYDALTEPALMAAGLQPQRCADGRVTLPNADALRSSARRSWAVRRMQGKLLSIFRLTKGIFTFDGGLEYILWKIERHSGVSTPLTDWQRRHPLLAAPGLAWRLYRRGAFR